MGARRAPTAPPTSSESPQPCAPTPCFPLFQTIRSNTSDYYVNGRKASAKDVAALLSSKGIDLDNNRFLILQVGLGGWVGVLEVGAGVAAAADYICF